MIILNFNTKTHQLTFSNPNSGIQGVKPLTFDNITTIKLMGDVYEVYQKSDTGLTVPFGKFPVSQTVILYSHE